MKRNTAVNWNASAFDAGRGRQAACECVGVFRDMFSKAPMLVSPLFIQHTARHFHSQFSALWFAKLSLSRLQRPWYAHWASYPSMPRDPFIPWIFLREASLAAFLNATLTAKSKCVLQKEIQLDSIQNNGINASILFFAIQLTSALLLAVHCLDAA